MFRSREPQGVNCLDFHFIEVGLHRLERKHDLSGIKGVDIGEAKPMERTRPRCRLNHSSSCFF